MPTPTASTATAAPPIAGRPITGASSAPSAFRANPRALSRPGTFRNQLSLSLPARRKIVAGTKGCHAMVTIGKLLRDTRGIGTIEYALVAMLISVGAISGYANL